MLKGRVVRLRSKVGAKGKGARERKMMG